MVSAPGRSGLFLYSQGKITALVQNGDPAPEGGTFDTASTPSLNSSGQVAFLGALQSERRGAYLWSQGKVSPIAQTGDPTPRGGLIAFISLPTINSSGQVAFSAGLSTGGQGVFVFSEGKLTEIVRTGDPVPGGGTFQTLGNASLNDRGQVSFSGFYGTGSAIFLASDGEIHTIVRSGDPAPGGGTFSLGLPFSRLNAAGQLTFSSFLSTGQSGVFVAELK